MTWVRERMQQSEVLVEGSKQKAKTWQWRQIEWVNSKGWRTKEKNETVFQSSGERFRWVCEEAKREWEWCRGWREQEEGTVEVYDMECQQFSSSGQKQLAQLHQPHHHFWSWCHCHSGSFSCNPLFIFSILLHHSCGTYLEDHWSQGVLP